jgi:hypothetical protein
MARIALVALLALSAPALALANPKPSALVPRHTKDHVYGSPIQKPILGQAKAPRHKHVPTKPAHSSPPANHSS